MVVPDGYDQQLQVENSCGRTVGELAKSLELFSPEKSGNSRNKQFEQVSRSAQFSALQSLDQRWHKLKSRFRALDVLSQTLNTTLLRLFTMTA